MKLHYHYARQRRQFSFLAKQLVRQRAAGKSITTHQLSRLWAKAKALAPKIGGAEVRRVLGTGLLLLAGAAAQAQTFQAPVANPFGLDDSLAIDNYYNQAAFADIDGDGDLDFFTTFYDEEANDDLIDSSDLVFYENVGTAAAPNFSGEIRNPFGFLPSHELSTLSFVDLDGDGDLDLMATGYTANDDRQVRFDILYYENTGTATDPAFAEAVNDPFNLRIGETDDNSQPLLFGDIDGDGDLDLLTHQYQGDYNNGSNATFFIENETVNDTVKFAVPVESPFGFAIEDYVGLTALADIDSDGDLDLLGSNLEAAGGGSYLSSVIFIENVGSANAPEFNPQVSDPFGVQPLSFEDGDSFVRVSSADLDGDGDLDLFFFTDGGILYLENTALTSVRERSNIRKVKAFPNPTTGQVLLDTGIAITSIEVIDVMGRLCLTDESGRRSLDLSALRSGTYTLRILTSTGKIGLTKIYRQ